MGIQLQSEDNDCKCSHHGETIIHNTYNCIPCLTSINKVCLSYFKYPVWIISEAAPPGIKALQGAFHTRIDRSPCSKNKGLFSLRLSLFGLARTQKTLPDLDQNNRAQSECSWLRSFMLSLNII